MADPVVEGGCLCGGIRYAAHGAPTVSMICHCNSCCRAAGSPVVAWLTFPRSQFSFARGLPSEFHSTVSVTRTFCATCGTSLTYVHAERPTEIDVTTSSLDHPEAFPPTYHAWVSDDAGWLRFADGLPAYQRSSRKLSRAPPAGTLTLLARRRLVVRRRREAIAMEIEGGCYCGALRFRATGDALFKGQCHCRECQYISGGHPNAVMAMPEPGFKYTKGSPKAFRRRDLPNPVTREFCAECGTHILAKSPAVPGALIMKVGTFDDPSVYGGPQMVIFTIDKQSFHHVPEGVPAFERVPG